MMQRVNLIILQAESSFWLIRYYQNMNNTHIKFHLLKELLLLLLLLLFWII